MVFKGLDGFRGYYGGGYLHPAAPEKLPEPLPPQNNFSLG